MTIESPLEEYRRREPPVLPKILQDLSTCYVQPDSASNSSSENTFFPHTGAQPKLLIDYRHEPQSFAALRVGVVLSGGQAAGGHNVIIGLFDALKKLNPKSCLFGFLSGPSGILKGDYRELTETLLDPFRNTGGFDLIGSGRTKIETPEQFLTAQKVLEELQLDGLVIIGGDDSNTNAALLAEYLCANGSRCQVVGAPKTIDGDLRSEDVEVSFGFDTACKTFSETIGSIARDALSAKKYYHFIKLMGRSASHITLECALQTHPNMALIGEEVVNQRMTLRQVTDQIANMICQRAEENKNYGVILIPEGIIEFIPEYRKLIGELNGLSGQKDTDLSKMLSSEAYGCLQAMPATIRIQLLLDRDPHGNVQVSKIETERLLIAAVEDELRRRQEQGRYKGKFNAQPHFLGYEGRSCFPSHFDSNYCYTLGHVCALLIQARATGYIAFVKGLASPIEEWKMGGASLANMIHLEERKGEKKPVIRKALVDLEGRAFEQFAKQRIDWAGVDAYRYPGPIQFFGPAEITHAVPMTLTP